MVRSQTHDFDWRIYADATCAGLSALIPIPLVDVVIERSFRRRMPAAIARVNGRSLRPEDRARLGRSGSRLLSLAGCLMLPIAAVRYLARFIWHKVVYVLAVADAASLVSAYWHRAYLMDHVIRAGHVDPGADADWAIVVFFKALDEVDPTPLVGLARQVVSTSRRILGLLPRALRQGTAGVTKALGEILGTNWDAAEQSLRAVAMRYNELYVRRPGSPSEVATPHGGAGVPEPEGGPLARISHDWA